MPDQQPDHESRKHGDTPPPPDPRPPRQSGDGWVQCRCGRQHWGLNGAAGLLLWHAPADGPPRIVLQHRALWSHHGGTWGLPGGALADGETPVTGAVREAAEEAGVPPEVLQVHASRVLEHPDWSYTTVVAEARADFAPDITDHESLEVAWVDLEDVGDLPLLPAFADALPELRGMARRLVLVIDAANVVGSRPDGWWRDRKGAATRLRNHLSDLARAGVSGETVGLPGERWFPHVVMVVEGAARGIEPAEGVHVVSAPGSGDDEIVAQVARYEPDDAEGGTTVVVATADQELTDRVRALGAHVVGPRSVRG